MPTSLLLKKRLAEWIMLSMLSSAETLPDVVPTAIIPLFNPLGNAITKSDPWRKMWYNIAIS
jgi:hypothetical protein